MNNHQEGEKVILTDKPLVKLYEAADTINGVGGIVITITTNTPDSSMQRYNDAYRQFITSLRDRLRSNFGGKDFGWSPNNILKSLLGWSTLGSTAIIVDGQNAFFSQKAAIENKEARDYLDPIWMMRGIEPHIKIIHKAWVAAQKGSDQEAFISRLEENGWVTQSCSIGRKNNGTFRGNLDHLVSDEIFSALAKGADTFVIFTGDGDFLPKVKALVDMGKKVFLVSHDSCINEELKSLVYPRYIPIQNLMKKVPKDREDIFREAWWTYGFNPRSVKELLSDEEFEYVMKAWKSENPTPKPIKSSTYEEYKKEIEDQHIEGPSGPLIK